MKFNPDLQTVLTDHMSRYSLVIAAAKRAREISEAAQENGEILTEKTISLALEEFIEGKVKIIEPEEIRNI